MVATQEAFVENAMGIPTCKADSFVPQRATSAGSKASLKARHSGPRKVANRGATTRLQATSRDRRLYVLSDATNASVSVHSSKQTRQAGTVQTRNGQSRVQVPGWQALDKIVSDIDAPYDGNIQLVPTYANANAEYMREQEIKHSPRPDYMLSVQHGRVKAHMRETLVDWLIEVAEEFRLVTETLFLSVAYLDQFLSLRAVSPTQLQLLGVTCMSTAAKFEEIFPPPASRFVDIMDGAFGIAEIAKAEQTLLATLNFHLAVPTAKVFLQRFLRAAQAATAIEFRYLEQLARYLLELALIDYTMLEHKASVTAAAALFLARALLAALPPQAGAMPGRRAHMLWTRTMEHYTWSVASELAPAVSRLHTNLLAISERSTRAHAPCAAVRLKYLSPRRAAVAALPVATHLPPEIFQPYHVVMVPHDPPRAGA